MDKFRDLVVRIALVLALLLPAYFLFAALGVKFGLIDWRTGLRDLTLNWGMKAVVPTVLGAGAIALALAFFTPPRRGMNSALIALLIPALTLGFGLYVRQQAQSIPPIHDISTDLTDPPSFSAEIARAREAVPGANDLDLLTKRDAEGTPFIEWQRRGYGDITHLSTGLDPARAFEVVSGLVHEQGWRVGRRDPENWMIEAVAESFWFGFKDDIALRVRANGSGARVDMRSVSRVGISDLGVNAARTRSFLSQLRARLEDAEAQAGPAVAPPREGSAAETPLPPPP